MTYQPMPAPPPKKSKTLRTVLIVVAVVLTLCCVGGGIGGFFLYRTVQDATGPARDATTGYVDDLGSGNYPGAYGRLCNRMRSEMTADEFARMQSIQPRVASYKITGLSVNNTNGRVTGTATVRLTQDGGATVIQVLPLVKEDGEWRICQ
ncbi:hypothetical protein GCM10027290_48840 [Micromonospora sonneratiae]|uniref:DUF4878 domain-containing protein n=1 Tax=Micromonospora sonneratiae TaxID=1184706 RepID=A0ABW3YNU4_9ACTN